MIKHPKNIKNTPTTPATAINMSRQLSQSIHFLNHQPQSQNNTNTTSTHNDIVQYSIAIMFQHQFNIRQTITGQVMLSWSASMEDIKCAIMQNIDEKSKYRSGSGRLIICRKQGNIVNSHKQKICIFGQQRIEGIFIQNKIELSPNYQYLPSKFQSNSIRNLTICNNYGCVTWPGIINIKQINFKQSIKIQQNQIVCNSVPLQKQVLLQLYKVPSNIKAKTESASQIEKKLKKHVQKMKNKCFRFLKYNEDNGHWFVVLNLASQFI